MEFKKKTRIIKKIQVAKLLEIIRKILVKQKIEKTKRKKRNKIMDEQTDKASYKADIQ